MFESTREPGEKGLLLSKEILGYYDEFTEFNEYCAFLCDAFAGVAARCESLDENSVRGLERSAHWLKYRVRELKEKLRTIQEIACSEAGTFNG